MQEYNTPIKRHRKSKQYDTVLQCIFAKLFNLRLANDIDRYSIKNERRQTVMSWEARNNFLVCEYERAQTKSAKKYAATHGWRTLSNIHFLFYFHRMICNKVKALQEISNNQGVYDNYDNHKHRTESGQ